MTYQTSRCTVRILRSCSTSPAILLVLALGAVSGCQNPVQAPPPAPPEVGVASPTRGDVAVMHDFTGNTVAYQTAEIRARITGFLDRIAFTDSARVRKGELLFVIEQEPYEAQRDRAAANLASAEANLRRAESDLERLEQAVRTNAVSQQEVTRARAERDQASAAMLEAQATLRNAEIQLSYTTISSPIDGVIGRHLVDTGNLVGAGGSTLLATVVTTDPIYAYWDMSERLVAQYLQEHGGRRPQPNNGEGPEVQLILDEGDMVVAGRVDYIDNQVDRDTGTIMVRGVFPNPDGILVPGFFVRLQIRGEVHQDAVLIDERGVGTDLGGKFVLVVDDNDVVEQRYVELGEAQPDGSIEVLNGLDGHERYIVEGVLRARAGMPVTPAPLAEGI